MKAFCSSVNVYGMVVLFAGNGDASPLIGGNRSFFAAGGGDPKT